ncbi:AAA family ATPase [Clostridium chromiireducens]|uniref:AAA family ATPase n=1 Tax=Clostridium chromiireducens TaxID=225345 RepID=UPI003AF86360
MDKELKDYENNEKDGAQKQNEAIEDEVLNEDEILENKEIELQLKREEILQEEKKLKFKDIVLKKKEEKLNDREEAFLEEMKKLEEERQALREERLNYQKECEERANFIVEDIKNRNKELAQKVTELSSIEYENESIKFELKNKEENIKKLAGELVECKNKLKLLEDQGEINDIISLREKLEEYESLKEEKEKLFKENKVLRDRNKALEADVFEKDRLDNTNEILMSKLERTQSQLRYLKHLEKSKGTGEDSSQIIFKEIIEEQIELDKDTIPKVHRGDGEFIKEFIQFCRKYGFIYEEDLVRNFICSIRSSKLTILKGYSGTGKSSLPNLLSKFLKCECVVIPVQPNWRTKQDIMGFYNYFTNKFIPTELTKTLIRANVSKNRIFIVVLDEMNLARVEYYFSEFNSKLELDPKSREIELFEGVANYDGIVSEYIKDNKVKIPDNVYFVGTINEDDSVSPISDKIFDRSQVVEFMQLPTTETAGDLESACRDSITNEYTSFKSFNSEVEEDDFNINIVNEVNRRTKEYFNKVIGFRSLKQIKTFVRFFINSGGKEKEAIDMQLVSKFIPKLKFMYSDEQISALSILSDEIKELFKKELKCHDNELNNLQMVKQLEVILKELEN